jgi:hypothetical protein
MNAWLEALMWLCMGLSLAVDYIASYADLATTFAAFGYPFPVNFIMPLGIDLPATASVLGQLLAGRWQSHWWVRARLGLLTALTAPLTLVGNALRGAIDVHGHFTFHVSLWWDLMAFAVPGAGVVVIGYIASMMQAEKAELRRRQLEGELAAGELAGREPATGGVTDERRRKPGPLQQSGHRRPRGRPARIPPEVVAGAMATLTSRGERLTGPSVAAEIRAAGYDVTDRHALRLIPDQSGAPPRRPEQPEEPEPIRAPEAQLVGEGAP